MVLSIEEDYILLLGIAFCMKNITRVLKFRCSRLRGCRATSIYRESLGRSLCLGFVRGGSGLAGHRV